MSQCLFKSYHLLRYLSDSKANIKLVTVILKNADKDLLDSFSELFTNLANGVVPGIEKKQIEKYFKKLTSRTYSRTSKIKLLLKLRRVWLKPVSEALDILKSICNG